MSCPTRDHHVRSSSSFDMLVGSSKRVLLVRPGAKLTGQLSARATETRLLYAETAPKIRSVIAHERAAVDDHWGGAAAGLDVHRAACLRITTLLRLQTWMWTLTS